MSTNDAYYRSLCCALTLQSDKKGFFQEFAESVCETVGPEWIKRFGKLNSDRERIIRCYTDEKILSFQLRPLENDVADEDDTVQEYQGTTQDAPKKPLRQVCSPLVDNKAL
ncbi:hypothetical protein AAG570_005272 [Ranatra chinensis]|uniref:Uncharacterized protein n=1 Tax=Ranatra chinensis TaxID=642074 RepID=A0ABD0Y0V0_9HEMI